MREGGLVEWVGLGILLVALEMWQSTVEIKLI